MVEVFICEDELEQRMRIEMYIKNYIMIENLDMALSISSRNPYEILEYIEENSIDKGLYFLDVDLKADITGIDLAIRIREKDKRGVIVFITTHPEYMALTFEHGVEALGYITKGPIEKMKEKIAQCMNLARNRLLLDETKKHLFQIKRDGKIITEKYEDIMFFEISPDMQKKVILSARKRRIDFYGKLGEIEKESTRFFRCHRSFVVNLDNIQEINKKELIIKMKDGSTCLLSKRSLKNLISAI